MMRALLIASALIAPPALAQTPPIDPGRLAAARALVEQINPADRRDAMIEAMTKPTMDRMREAIVQSPQFAGLTGNAARVREVLASFMDRFFMESIAVTRASMPKLMEATATAYARQFEVSQLNDVRVLFATQTGKAFMDKLPSLMADPAVVAVQREITAAEFANLPAMAEEMQAEINRLQTGKKP